MGSAKSAAPTSKSAWTSIERSMLTDIRHTLHQQGLVTESEDGETDEGDPWAVLYRVKDGVMVAHIARFDGQYVLLWPDQASQTARSPEQIATLLQSGWVDHLYSGDSSGLPERHPSLVPQTEPVGVFRAGGAYSDHAK